MSSQRCKVIKECSCRRPERPVWYASRWIICPKGGAVNCPQTHSSLAATLFISIVCFYRHSKHAM